MNIQQGILIFIEGTAVIIFLYYFAKVILIYKKFDKYLYFTISLFGVLIYALTEFMLSFPILDNEALIIHKLKLFSLSIIVIGWVASIFDIHFKKSKIPLIYAIIFFIISLTIPTDLYTSLPIKSININLNGNIFNFKAGTTKIFYIFQSLTVLSIPIVTFIKAIRNKLNWKSNLFLFFAFSPIVIGGINDYGVIYGFIKNVLISCYVYYLY